MNTSFTPGPWVAQSQADPQVWSINAPIGDANIGHKTWDGLAVVYGCDERPLTGAAVAAANAHLIAAAPDLYEALYEMAAQHKCGCGHPHCNACDRDALAKAALSKAKGWAA